MFVRFARQWFLGKYLWTFDLSIGILVTAAAWFLIQKYEFKPFTTLIDKDGTAIYAAILSTAGALLGFAIAIITIVQGLVSAKEFKMLRASEHYEAFWTAFVWSIRSLGISAVVSLIALFVGHVAAIWPAACAIVAWLTIAAIIGLGRGVRTLELLLRTYRKIQKDADDALVEVVTSYPDAT